MSNQLVRPVAGQSVIVPVDSDNMRLSLGFAPDPNAVQKNGQNLEFSFEDGGKIILQGYYDHFASKTLPVMVTEDGDELDGEEFLASLREDLLTTAGPGTGPGTPGGGAGEYADDPGVLVGGVDRLGSLGTIYWDYTSEEPIRPDQLGLPGTPSITDIVLSVASEIGAGVFEDARPFQYLGNYTEYLGQLNFAFTPGDGTVVTAVRLAGFAAGTEIYLGEPPVLLAVIADEGQILELTMAQIEGGVFLRPPLDSDLDMNITSSVDIMHEVSGLTETVAGPDFVITVDAVADKPLMDGDAGFADVEYEGSISVSETESASQELRDGWAVDQLAKNTTTVTTETAVRVSVDFSATIQFFDYLDGSETHYALVEVPSIGTWTLTATSPAGVVPTDPATITLYFDADGNCLGDMLVDGAVSSKEFYRFEVPNSVLETTNGVISLNITFTSSDTDLTSDYRVTLETGAMAVETPSDGELSSDNDKSYTFHSEGIDGQGELPNFIIDTVDSQLTVRIGWASEDNDNSQHVAGAYSPDYANMYDPADGSGIDPASTTANGAPILFSLDGTSGETIASVRLFFDPAVGTILVNGTAQTPAQDGNGNWYVELTQGNGLDGNATATTGGQPAVTFVPSVANSDIDVAMGYEVVALAPSGATLVYSGTSLVVIDAVADLPTNLEAQASEALLTGTGFVGSEDSQVRQDGWETDTFNTNQTSTVVGPFTLSLSAYFADTDGSETHYILISLPTNAAGWTFDAVSLTTAGLANTGQTYTENGVTYQMLQVIDGSVNQYSGSIQVYLNEASGFDATFSVFTGAMAVETTTSGYEYDLVNNTAVALNPEPVDLTMDVVQSGLNVRMGWASEDNDNGQHFDFPNGGYEPDYNNMYDPADGSGIDSDSTTASGAPIIFTLNEGTVQGTAESITSIRLYFDPQAGTLLIDGIEQTPVQDGNGNWYVELTQGNGLDGNATATVDDQPAVTFVSAVENGDADVPVRYEVTVVNGAGSTQVFNGTSLITIDAVADLPDADALSITAATPADDFTTPDGTEIEGKEHYDTQEALKPDESTVISGSATFTDNDGSEKHYIMVSLTNTNWTITGVNGTDDLLSMNDIYAYWGTDAQSEALTGAALDAFMKTLSDNRILTPQGDPEKYGDYPQHLLIEAYPVFDANGNVTGYDVRFLVSDGNGGVTEVTLPGATASFDIATGELTYSFDLIAPSLVNMDAGRSEATLYTKAITVETNLSGDEYDYANNVAGVQDSKSVTVKAASVTSKLEVTVTGVYEDGEANKHIDVPADPDDPDYVEPISNAGLIVINHTGTDANKEIVDKVVITLTGDAAANGDIWIGGVNYGPTVTLEFTSAMFDSGLRYTSVTINGIVFSLDSSVQEIGIPFDNLVNNYLKPTYVPLSGTYDDTDVTFDVSAVIVEPTSGATADNVTGDDVPIVVDAVADLAELQIGALYGESDEYIAAKPGAEVDLSITVSFPDTDGSERHLLVISLADTAENDWTITGLADGETLSVDDILSAVRAISGSADLTDKLDTGGWLIEMVQEFDANGNVTSTAFYLVDADGNRVGDPLPATVISVDGDGVIHLTATAPVVEGDTTAKLTVQAVSVETDPAGRDPVEGEFTNDDAYTNNVAVAEVTTDLNVNLVDGTLGVSAYAFEGDQPEKHGATKDTHVDQALIADKNKIVFDHSDPKEAVSVIVISHAATEGTFTFGGVTLEDGYAVKFEYTVLDDYTVLYKSAVVYDENGMAVSNVIDFADGSLAKVTGDNFKYTPNDGSVSDADVPFTFAAVIVDPASGYSVVAGNMENAEDNKNIGVLTGYNAAPIANDPHAATEVIVDAVADKPGVSGIALPEGDTLDDNELLLAMNGESKNADGEYYTQTAPGGTITVPVSVTFADYLSEDGYAGSSEDHSILVQLFSLNSGGTFNATLDTVQYSAAIVDGVIQAAVDALPADLDNYRGETFTYLDEDSGLTVEITVDAEGNLSDRVTVTASPVLTVPEDLASDVGTVRVMVRGIAAETVDTAGLLPSDEEMTAINNTAYGQVEIDIDVDRGSSGMRISMVTDRVYENAQPEAYQGNYEIGGYEFSGQSGNAYANAEFVEATPDYANVEFYAAKIAVTGVAEGDSVSITFTLGLTNGGSLPADVTDWGVIVVNGQAFAVDSDGTCTVTFVGEGVNETTPLYYVPGVNYSSDDLTLTWTATVTDADSGAVQTPASTDDGQGALGIIVDAVAQEVQDLTVGLINENGLDADATDATNYVSQSFELKLSATFEDADGSEGHYFLVEMTSSTTLDSALYAALGLTADDIFIPSDGPNAGKVFYMISVEALENAGCITTNGDETVATVTMTTKLGDTGTDSIVTGAMTVEEAIGTNGDRDHGLYTKDGFNVPEDLSKTNINNISMTWTDPVEIEVALATTAGSAQAQETYEDEGRLDAHIGDTDTTAYAQLQLDLSGMGAGDEVSGGTVTITYDPNAGSIWQWTGSEYTLLDASGSVTVDVADATGGNLVFVPAAGYNDQDTQVNWVYTIEDTRSGHTVDMDVVQNITIDAVAQRPEDPESEQGDGGIDSLVEGGSTDISVSVTFKDWDEATDHYILVEAPAGWKLKANGSYATIIDGPDGKQYFQVKVDPDNVDVDKTTNTATATLTATLIVAAELVDSVTVLDRTLEGNMPDTLHYGGMSEDRANLSDSGSEATWHNNTSYNLTGEIALDYATGGPGGEIHFQIAPVFENDTPFAHETTDPASAGGGLITIDKKYFDLENGGILTFTGLREGDSIGGVTAGADGTITVEWDGVTPLHYVPGENYSDADAPITLTAGSMTASYALLVDAVAQIADIVTGAEPAYGHHADAARPEEAVTITVKTTLYDVLDGSTEHYVLVERLPGWEAEGNAGTIYVDGKTYFMFEAALPDDEGGTVTQNVQLIPPADGGTYNATRGTWVYEDLEVKVLSRETVTDNEIVSENNTALADAGSVTIEVSRCTITASVNTEYIYENDGTAETIAGAALTLTVSAGAHDTVDSIVLNVGDATGTFYLASDTDHTNPLTVDNGTIILSRDDYPDLYLNNGLDELTVSLDIVWIPDAYSNKDITVSLVVTGHDSLSGDDGAVTGTGHVYVDGAAWAPEWSANPDVSEVSLLLNTEDGAVKPNGDFSFTLSATFADTDAQNEYLLIEYKPGWDYGTDGTANSLAKVYGPGNTQYLKINVNDIIDDLDSGGVWTDPATGIIYTVTVTGETVTVTAEIPMTAPTNDLTRDGYLTFSYGAATEDHSDTDVNDNIQNDYAYSFAETALTVPVGVVETTHVTAFGSADEDQYAELDFSELIAAYNEEIVSVEFTVPQGVTLYVYDTDANEWKSYVVSGATAELDPGTRYAFKLNDPHSSGEIAFTFTAEVKDNASGDTKELPSQSGSVTIYGTSSSGDYTDSSSTNQPYVVGTHEATVSLTLAGTFEDNDGSEEHYFYVQLPEGMSTTGLTPVTDVGYNDGTWYKVAATQSQGSTTSTATITVTVQEGTTGSGIKVVAVAKETQAPVAGNDAAYYSDEYTITLDPTALTYNAAPETTSTQDVPAGVSIDASTASSAFNLTEYFSDSDKDTLLVTAVSVNGTNQYVGAGSPASFTLVNGITLTVSQDGTATLSGLEEGDAGKTLPVIAVTVSDSHGGTVTGYVQPGLYVPANNAPEGTGDIPVTEQIADVLNGSLGSLFMDSDGDVVTLATVNGETVTFDTNGNSNDITADNGTLVLHQDGQGGYSYTYTYTGDPALGEVDSFTFAAVDEHGEASINNPTLTITFDPITQTLGTGEGADGTQFGWDLGVTVSGQGDNIIHGGDGDDTITLLDGGTAYGGDGADTIYLMAGGTAYGGAGSDRMYGGDGVDIFGWTTEDIEAGLKDTILSFTMDQDQLLFDDALETSNASFNATDGTLTFDLSNATATQSVSVTFVQTPEFAEFVEIYNNYDQVGQEKLVADLIKNIAG